VDSGSPEKTLVRVTIFQQPYTLRSSGEPGETEALAQAVDSLMNQIAARTSGTDPTRVAVLAALHLADRVRHLEKRLERVRSAVSEAAARIGGLTDGPGPSSE
jgi:cell division protein ZapA (FtsZ GTPase activity inhibitor)